VTFEERAAEVIHKVLKPGQEGFPTGLRKRCPQCKRSGLVYVIARDAEDASFAIVWEGSRVAPDGVTINDLDLGVDIDSLLDADFGCGADRPKQTEGPPTELLN
jgi:hypothetical protein